MVEEVPDLCSKRSIDVWRTWCVSVCTCVCVTFPTKVGQSRNTYTHRNLVQLLLLPGGVQKEEGCDTHRPFQCPPPSPWNLQLHPMDHGATNMLHQIHSETGI